MDLLHLSGVSAKQKFTPEGQVIFEANKDKLESICTDCEKNRGHPVTPEGQVIFEANKDKLESIYTDCEKNRGHPVTPEGKVIFEASKDRLESIYTDCEKNRGHPNFINAKEFRLEHLPEHIRTEKNMRYIMKRCERTVKVQVCYTSNDRPDLFSDTRLPYPYSEHKGCKNAVRFGTGYILDIDKTSKALGKCLCYECQNPKNSPKMEYWEFLVVTATHIVYDDLEARHSVFECFFDTPDRAGVKKLYGVGTFHEALVPGSHYKSDLCYVRCVTHDSQIAEKLSLSLMCSIEVFSNAFDYLYPPPEEVIVSHPHGCSKRITVGKSIVTTFPIHPSYKRETPNLFKTDTICRLPTDSSKSSKNSMQSLPKNVFQMLRFLCIHQPDRDMGKLPFMNIADRYIRKYADTKKEQGNILGIILGSACGLYRYAIEFDIVSETFEDLKKLYKNMTLLICLRLQSMKSPEFDLQNPEIIDIGLVLLMSCLNIAIGLFKTMKYMEEYKHNVKVIIVPFVISNIVFWYPEMRKLLNLQEYVMEKSEKYFQSDHEFSGLSDAMTSMVTILSGHNLLRTLLEKDIKKSITRDILRHNNYDGVDGIHINDYYSSIIQFFSDYNGALKVLDDVHEVIEAEKSLVDPRSENFLQPGTEFYLPCNMSYTLPRNAEYLFKYYKGSPGHYKFPPGTKFYFVYPENRQVEFPLPDGAEFRSIRFDTELKYFVDYDIDTCPGSSGAFVYNRLPMYLQGSFQLHTGMTDDNNRSGMASRDGNFLEMNMLLNHLRENT